jgi:hypothetical protein
MPSEVVADEGERLADGLIRMLHQGASADDFAARLARAEALAAAGADSADSVELVRMAMSVRNRLDLWEQRERGMLTVIDSARDLSSRLDLRELLRAIVSRARNMLGSQVAWLSTYDAELAAFHVLATDGALSEGTGGMVADRGFGIVSVVLATRLPFSTPDYLHDTRFPHDPRLDATFRDEGIAAVVGVPMLWEDEVIGLLFVADRYHRTHGAQNISILSTLATHAAVAIKNARAFEQARAAVQSAEAARAALERHSRQVQAAAEAHEQLTSLLARGASLASLCEAVAGLMEGSLLVLDEAAQVIARASASGYAAGGADTYAPHAADSSALAAAIGRSRQLGRSVVAWEADGETCRVSAVIGGDDMLGAVLLFRRGELDETSVRTFERSTSIVGIVLLSRERMEASKVRDLSTLLRGLVSPRQDDLSLLCERAARFGLDLSQPSSLMLIDVGPQAAYAARRLRAANALGHAIVDEIDGALAVLCPTSLAEDLRRSAQTWVRGDFGAAFRGILSRPLSGPPEIPAVYVSLRRALSILERIGVQGHIVGQNEIALYATLFESHDQASLAAFLESTIGALTAHDDRRGSDLAATLLVYFDCNQNAKLAAQRLDIHVNTMRQRLSTIEDLVGYWGQATRALELHIALRLWSLSGSGPGQGGR